MEDLAVRRSGMRVAALIDGERHGRGVSATKNGPFLDALEQHVELCAVGDMMLRGWQRLLCVVAAWRPRPSAWRGHYRVNPLTFWMRSRRSSRWILHLPARPDVIVQVGALSRPINPRLIPYVLYLDFTHALTTREWPERSPMGHLERRLWRKLERWTYTGATLIFCRGTHVARSLQDDYGIPAEKIRVIGAGVNIPLPDLASLPARHEPHALFIGSDFARKGGEVLLRAWPSVRRRIPSARLTIFGKPTGRLPAGVKAHAVAWDRESVARAFAEAAVYVMPSLCETWGDAFLEAMAYALPCVGVAADAMPEIITDGETGFVPPRGNVNALATRLVTLLENPSRGREMGLAGRTRVETRFRWPSIVSHMVAELEHALPQPARAAGQAAAAPPRRLRVLQVIDSLAVGGAEQLLVTLARSIDRTRFDLRVCSLAPVRDGPIVQDLRASGIPIYSLGKRRLRDVRHITQLARLLRAHDIDVVHSHLSDANILGVGAAALARRPLVATLHNVRDVYPRFGAVKQALQNGALRLGARLIIACAPEVRSVALARLHLPAARLIDVPNGIDLQAFAAPDPEAVQAIRREFLGVSEGPLVVSVANLRPSKGQEYLVEAAGLLRARLPGLRVVIAGHGRAYEPTVRARIAALGLEDVVALAGARRDVPLLLAACDLFVLPSLLEGLPLALLEALAAGRPVVATAVGGVPRVVEEGVTGRLVAPGAPAALAAAMADVLSTPGEARRLAQAGQRRVRATYGAEEWARRLEGIYTSVALDR